MRKNMIIVHMQQIESLKKDPFATHTWKDFYEEESQIIDSLSKIDVKLNSDFYYEKIYSGYQTVHSLARLIQKGYHLSDKQLKESKRLSLQIKRAELMTDIIKKFYM